MEFETLIGYGIKTIIVVASLIVAFSPNILYAAFSLMTSFFCVAILYVIGGADFLAGAQVIVYVGGILVVIIFAIMLSYKIYNIPMFIQIKRAVFGGLIGSGVIITSFHLNKNFPWKDFIKPEFMGSNKPEVVSAVEPIGNALLREYVLPFEAVSLLLLVALIGSMVMSRPSDRDKEAT